MNSKDQLWNECVSISRGKRLRELFRKRSKDRKKKERQEARDAGVTVEEYQVIKEKRWIARIDRQVAKLREVEAKEAAEKGMTVMDYRSWCWDEEERILNDNELYDLQDEMTRAAV